MTRRSRAFLIGFVSVALIGAVWYFFQSSSDFSTEEEGAADSVISDLSTPLELPTTDNKTFAAGEKLHYNIIFKGITVGRSTIEIKDGPLVNDRPTLQYISTARSTKFFDNFFKVRDENISTVDKASLFSVAFDQNLREGHYRAVRHYTFDYTQRKFTWSQTKKGNTKNKEGRLEAPFHDVLSALYFVRTQELTAGKDLMLSVFRNNTGIPLPIKIASESKELKTALGKISCLRVEPIIQGDSLFKSKDNKLVVWMTNDEKKIPVLMEATISVGLVRVKLDKWEK